MTLKTALRDGVKLRYLDMGRGNPPLLFIHGWCCNHTFWREQIPEFQRRHRVIAVDLRGHGESDKPEQEYTIAGFVDDVAWLCGAIGLLPPIVVGHSMGGVIALRLALDRPEMVKGVVLVDASPLPPPAALAGQLDGLTKALESPSYQGVAAAYVGFMFTPYSDPALKQDVTSIMTNAPQYVMASAFSSTMEEPSKFPAGDLPVPALLVAAGHRPLDLADAQARFPNLQTARVVGAGHFLQMEVPEQFNAMLHRFIEVSL